MKKTIFLSAALYSTGLRRLNGKIRRLIEKEGFEVFLPQERCPITKNFSSIKIFETNLSGVISSDIIVIVFDKAGNGGIFEASTAYAKGKTIVGVLFKKSNFLPNQTIKSFWDELKFKARSLAELRKIMHLIKRGIN